MFEKIYKFFCKRSNSDIIYLSDIPNILINEIVYDNKTRLLICLILYYGLMLSYKEYLYSNLGFITSYQMY